jgi:hypothetical protein
MDPEQLLDTLKTNADARRTRSLETINAICREQIERGSKDFSVATIGRLSEKAGGPATQTIRNRTGGDFKALISAWAQHTGGFVQRQPKVIESPLYAVLEKIPDPAVRAVMGAVLAENRKLKGEVNLLKQSAEITIDQRPVQAAAKMQILPALTGVTDSEIEALRHAISDKLMNDEVWTIDEKGRILSKGGATIFKAGFATAIRKVLASIEAT